MCKGIYCEPGCKSSIFREIKIGEGQRNGLRNTRIISNFAADYARKNNQRGDTHRCHWPVGSAVILVKNLLINYLKVDTLSYRTETPNAQSIEREWVVIDATDQILGRLCAKVAKILRGKYKPCYSPNIECGDNVIIINADKVRLTGKKMTDRVYLSYTGYPGGQRATTPEVLMKKSFNKHLKPGYNPLFIKVMKGMLPKNRLGRRIIENMHVYNGSEHPHEAQNPKVIDINKLN